MAPPPPPPTATLSERLMALAQTLQFSWFIGHLTLLLTTLRYTFSAVRFNSTSVMAKLSYRLAFISAAVTYGIVVYKAYRGRTAKAGPGTPQQNALTLISDENVQYLLMALVWLYSKPIWFALLPFAVYSTFHFLTYIRTNIIPTFSSPTPGSTGANGKPTTQHPVSEAISKFVKQNYDTSMHLVSNLEIFLWVRVLLGALVFRNSWILLAIYTVFLRVRYAQSNFVRQSFGQLEKRGDALVANPNVPEAAKNAWFQGKGFLKQALDATNMGIKAAANGASPRKTQ